MTRTVADFESFITLLPVACENKDINAILERLLSQPDARRRGHLPMSSRTLAGT